MSLSSNVVYLLSAGIVLVPVLQWSDVLTGWFKKIIPASSGALSGLAWVLVITVIGGLILWGLSKLNKGTGSSEFFTSAWGILSLAVVFFVGSVLSDYLGALVKGFFGVSSMVSSPVVYALIVTALAIFLLWLLGKITNKPTSKSAMVSVQRAGSPGRVRVTATPIPTEH